MKGKNESGNEGRERVNKEENKEKKIMGFKEGNREV